jgi:hypothetical protein
MVIVPVRPLQGFATVDARRGRCCTLLLYLWRHRTSQGNGRSDTRAPINVCNYNQVGSSVKPLKVRRGTNVGWPIIQSGRIRHSFSNRLEGM